MDRRDFIPLALFLGVPFWNLSAAELSEGDRLLIETAQLLGVVSGASDKFSLVNQYVNQRDKVTAYLETRYQGMTVDWTQLPAQLKVKAP